MGSCIDYILLNLTFVISCIPIITIGASCVALYRCVRNHMDEKKSTPSYFFRVFAENFKKVTPVWIVALLFLAAAVTDVLYMRNVNVAGGSVISGVLLIVSVMIIGVLSYLFPLIAQNDLPVKQLLVISFFTSIQKIYITIPLIVMNLFPIIFPVLMPDAFAYLLTIWIGFLFSLICYGDALIIRRIFGDGD